MLQVKAYLPIVKSRKLGSVEIPKEIRKWGKRNGIAEATCDERIEGWKRKRTE